MLITLLIAENYVIQLNLEESFKAPVTVQNSGAVS